MSSRNLNPIQLHQPANYCYDTDNTAEGRRCTSAPSRVQAMGVERTIIGTAPDDKRKGEVHQAAVAAMVLGNITVHQLLLTQGEQLSRVDGVRTLHGSRRGERPARTALQNSEPLQNDERDRRSNQQNFRTGLPTSTPRQEELTSLPRAGREITIRTYLLLVLDISDGALLAPVDAGRRLVIGVLEPRRLAGSQTSSLQLRPVQSENSTTTRCGRYIALH
jgi:hypothetical protein